MVSIHCPVLAILLPRNGIFLFAQYWQFISSPEDKSEICSYSDTCTVGLKLEFSLEPTVSVVRRLLLKVAHEKRPHTKKLKTDGHSGVFIHLYGRVQKNFYWGVHFKQLI
jgi:hypothetical protein